MPLSLVVLCGVVVVVSVSVVVVVSVVISVVVTIPMNSSNIVTTASALGVSVRMIGPFSSVAIVPSSFTAKVRMVTVPSSSRRK